MLLPTKCYFQDQPNVTTLLLNNNAWEGSPIVPPGKCSSVYDYALRGELLGKRHSVVLNSHAGVPGAHGYPTGVIVVIVLGGLIYFFGAPVAVWMGTMNRSSRTFDWRLLMMR